jgi:hypothetical protein
LYLKKLGVIAFIKSHNVLVRYCNSRRRVFVWTDADYRCFAASISCGDWTSDQDFLTKVKAGHVGLLKYKSEGYMGWPCIDISKAVAIIQKDLPVSGYKKSWKHFITTQRLSACAMAIVSLWHLMTPSWLLFVSSLDPSHAFT